VVREGMWMTVGGVAIGMIAAVWLTRFIAGLLYGVPPLDPLTFVAVPLVLLVVAGLASWIPARRAAGVDPVIAIRAD
jgi:ABC-type antimicrobial peptide transport system permease subunit